MKNKFQSTRPHGARPFSQFASAGLVTFQSTRPHGARHMTRFEANNGGDVSIHAPARGATPYTK
jgi:hypothetical protein